jgi:hypothetical protein
MTKNKHGECWTFPENVVVYDLPIRSALESYLDLLLARARYGKKLDQFMYPVYCDIEKIAAIEADQSLPNTTRKRLVRECEASIGKMLRLAAKHGVADVMPTKQWPRQSNQEKVFTAYRAVLGREERPPTFREWSDEMLNGRSAPISNGQRRKLDHVLREMQKRFKLPVTYRDDVSETSDSL